MSRGGCGSDTDIPVPVPESVWKVMRLQVWSLMTVISMETLLEMMTHVLEYRMENSLLLHVLTNCHLSAP